MSEQDIHILGVKHADDRIHSGVDTEADQVDNIDVVYHEWPESSHDTQEFLFWWLLKSPSSGFPAILYLLRSVLKMRRGVSVDSSGTAHVKSECKIAAERLRDEYDADLVNVGMNRIDLLKDRSWTSALFSWSIVILAVLIMWQAIMAENLAFLVAMLVPVVLSMGYRGRVLNNVREARDEHMANAILGDYTERPSSTGFVITGQKHIEGIASRVGRRYSPVCRWLSNEADIEPEE
ncbi:hypothetical protein [Haloarcula argentinensis]|uniref:Uncharacterized protein n=1 Tax=Haloarcula argentinensis TaxID=43776 RepID=A0A847UPQ1_HALAR|nr:hypothetical protein [Haloarcula argentinensis]NLV13954.1 hypothetical protein [Haloarcula argentinensis]